MKINITKRERILIIFSVFFGIIIGGVFFYSPGTPGEQTESLVNNEIIWTCSMHPQIRMTEAGQCPICGMDLIPVSESSPTDPDRPTENAVKLSPEALSLADIHTTVVKRGIPENTISLQGKVKADERRIAQLTSRFGGRIEKLLVNYTGQLVQKGTVLGKIYSPELITAQRELLEAIPYKTTNTAFYQAARTKLKLWNLSDQQIDAIENQSELQLYFDILSPISGTVTKRHVAVGDYVSEGSPLFEVIDLSHVWVMFEAYEQDLPWIKVGDLITFNIQSLPGNSFKGHVRYIDPFINPQTRVASVRVELDNSNKQLKPEMYSTGVLESKAADDNNSLLIPKSAILWTGKRAVVYVKEPDQTPAVFLYREIVLGPEAGNFFIVKSGLEEGEIIAFYGVFKIDAAAQLAGLPSMMNPDGQKNRIKRDHSISPESGQLMSLPLHKPEDGLHHTTFKVAGNCSMCKKRIETAVLSLDGVNSADWSTTSKMIQISYNSEKVSLKKIHKTIATAGHDTELESAPQAVYDSLPQCCLYRE